MRFENEDKNLNSQIGPLEDDELVADIDDIVIEDDLEDFTPEDAQKLSEELKEKIEEDDRINEDEIVEEVVETDNETILSEEVSENEYVSSSELEVSNDLEENDEVNDSNIEVETEEVEFDDFEQETEEKSCEPEKEDCEVETSDELENVDSDILEDDSSSELEVVDVETEDAEHSIDGEELEPEKDTEVETEEVEVLEDSSSELEVVEPEVKDVIFEETESLENQDDFVLEENKEPIDLDNATRIARLIEEMQSNFTQEEVINTPTFEPVETNSYDYNLEEVTNTPFEWESQTYNVSEEVTEMTEPVETEEVLEVEETTEEDKPQSEVLETEDVHEEEIKDAEVPEVEEGQMPVLTDDDFLREDEKHLPDKVKEMLIRARKEKLGIADESEKTKKKTKKNKKAKKDNGKEPKEDYSVDNTKALEVATRLDGFETYFYENIANVDLDKDPYIGSFYEEKHRLYEDRDLHGLDLKESVNQGFDAWLAKNYKLYTYKGKAKEIKRGFQDLATIPRFNNREIVPYVEKRGKLVAKFIHYFANDVYYDNSDKKIFAKKHSLYPIIDYDGEKVCYEYLKTIDCPEIENPAKKFYDTAKEEAYELVKSTSDYLAVVAKDYKYDFKAMNKKTGYRESHRLSKTVKPLCIWMLILFAIIQVINLLPQVFKTFGLEEVGTYINTYAPSITKYHVTISLFIILVPILAILLMLPTWILNIKVGKYKNIVERLNKILEHTTKIEATLSLETKKPIKYEKAIYKCKKNKVRIKEKVVKEAAVKYVDETAKLRHQLISKVGLKKITQALYIILVSALLSLIYSMIIVGTLSALIDIKEPGIMNYIYFSGAGAFIAFALFGLTTKKKGIARWRYHLAVLLSLIITIILLVLI